MVFRSTGKSSSFQFTYKLVQGNGGSNQQIQNDTNTQTTAGIYQLAKVDFTTMIVLSAIFGSLGLCALIAIIYCIQRKVRAYYAEKKKQTVKPMPTETGTTKNTEQGLSMTKP